MGAPPALRGIARALLVRRTALLVAIAIVAVAAAPASGALPAPVSSGDPFASCTAGSYVGGGTNFPASEVEPFVAADPKTPGRLVAVWQQDRWSGGGARGEVSAYSTNGGASWNPVVVPFGACADPGSPFSRVSDPWVTIGPDGIVYASAIAFGGPATGVVVADSRDGGRTWSGATAVIKQSAAHWLEDKDSITADPKRPGTAYVVWTRDPPTPNAPAKTLLSVTRNGGGTWSKPRAIVNPGKYGTTIGNIIAVRPATGRSSMSMSSRPRRPCSSGTAPGAGCRTRRRRAACARNAASYRRIPPSRPRSVSHARGTGARRGRPRNGSQQSWP